MEDGEPQCLLCVGVAVDLHVAALPPACPGRLVLRQHAAPADPSRSVKLLLCPTARVQAEGVAPHRGDGALETRDLSGTGFPAPGPLELAKLGRRKIAAVDLQQYRSRHGEALVGTSGVPHAEILLEPLGHEPKVQTFE
jgi:hypothetical protein